MIQASKTRIAASDYFEHPDYQIHDFIQLIDGEVIIPMPPILKHQMIVGNIFFLLKLVVRKLGGLVFVAPAEVKLDDNNVFEPDVFYILAENVSIAQQDDNRIIGAPNLVVEVLSPGTARYDRQQKYKAYEKHGVGEYWIVDPIHETVEVWVSSKEQKFERKGSFSIDDKFTSITTTTEFSVKDIFEEQAGQEDD
ncbi:MAG: Uma2 family endonuclease [Chloroflexota bacterium]